MKVNLFHIILVLLQLIVVNLYSQLNEVKFNRLDVDQGLSHPTVNAITQDKFGFLWLGTTDGLNRFDSKDFTSFYNNPKDSLGLSDSEIWSLFSSEESLWVGTSNGLNKFDYNSEKFTPIDVPLSNKRVSLLFVFDELIYCGNENELIVSKTSELSWQKIKVPPSIQISSISEFNGIVFLGCKNGKVLMFKNGEVITYSVLNKSEKIIDFDQWLGVLYVFTEPGNVYKMDGNKISLFYELKQTINVGKIHQGNIWLGSNDGLYRIQSNKQVNHFKHQSYNSSSLSGNPIRSLYTTTDDVLWIGTWGGGVSNYDPQIHRFKTARHDPFDSTTLSNNFVQCIFRLNKGDLLVGTKKGLNTTGEYNGSFSSYNSLLNEEYITCLFEDTLNEELWVGTESGICIFDTRTSDLIRVFSEENSNLLSNGVTSVFKDIQGRLWVASWSGLSLYNSKIDSFSNYQLNNMRMAILCSVQLDENHLLLGTYHLGIISFDLNTKKFKKVTHDKTGEPFPHERVWTILKSKNNDVWAGTFGAGLVKIKYDGDYLFKLFTKEDGLSSNGIIALEEDDKGNVWVAGNKGLMTFNSINNEFKKFDSRYGVQSNHFNAASFKDEKGILYFGGSSGLNWFKPEEIKTNPYSIKTNITYVDIFNKKGEETVKELKSIDEVYDYKLDYDQNNFQFGFIGTGFNTPEKTIYKYKLEGLDHNWYSTNAHANLATYTNVPSGEYVFKVKALNHDYIEGNEESISIFIRKPYWETWWFRITMTIIVLAIFYSIYRYRIEQVRKVERLRVKIASDLHDDVGGLLTQISLQSDLVSQGVYPTSQVGDEVNKIAETSRDAVKTMSDVVWSIDIRKQEMGDMIDRMKDYSFEVLEKANITINFEYKNIDLEDILSNEFRHNTYLMFKELINNTVKHAKANHIDVVIGGNEKRFYLKFSDNGKGMNHFKSKRVGQGLDNIKMRAERINTLVTFNSDNGFIVELKSKK